MRDSMSARNVAMACAGLLLLVGFSGCGVDDEPLRPRLQTTHEGLSAMTLEERKAATATQDEAAPYVFDRPGAEPEEAVADYRACRESLLENDRYLQTNGMGRLLLQIGCMGQKGWTYNEEGGAGPADGAEG